MTQDKICKASLKKVCEYFDVLEGTYELEQLDPKTVRLHLYSEFKLSTTFNFYAGLWGRWIMNDIQDNFTNRKETKRVLIFEIPMKSQLA